MVESALAPPETLDGVAMGCRIDAVLTGQAFYLGISLHRRKARAEVRDRSHERRSGKDRIAACGSLLALLLQSRLTLLVGLQRSESPKGPVPKGLKSQTVLLGNVGQSLFSIFVGQERLG